MFSQEIRPDLVLPTSAKFALCSAAFHAERLTNALKLEILNLNLERCKETHGLLIQ